MFLISLYHDMFQYTISLTVCQERGKGFKSDKFLFTAVIGLPSPLGKVAGERLTDEVFVSYQTML